MRTVAAGRVAERPVNDFLQDETPARVAGEVGLLEQAAEVLDVAVQVAGDEDLGGPFQSDERPRRPGVARKASSGAPEGGQKTIGVGHLQTVARDSTGRVHSRQDTGAAGRGSRARPVGTISRRTIR